MKGYDIIGNIAILKFERGASKKEKVRMACELMKKNKSVSTALEKTGKIKGRLRKLKTKYICGINTKEVLYKENGCVFRFNVDSCYFSPRLASERLEMAKMIKKNEKVLVMFGGVAPYAIIIAKVARPKRIVSVEISRECNKYAVENIRRNKVNVDAVQGNVRKVLSKMKEKFDRVVMARPNLEDNFLDAAFKIIRGNGILHYYGFYDERDAEKLKQLIDEEAKKARRKIKILKIKKAGDIGVLKWRYRADIKVF
ncbi:MAG: hypothetical protein AABW65_02075 [Nanoarchaeota archaeon]